MPKRYLITGGCGFLGSNLASAVLQRGHDLTVLDDLSRLGAKDNLIWLESQGEFRFCQADIRDAPSVEDAITDARPDVVFHLAGQVAMTTSLRDPQRDFAINTQGTLNVLDTLRRRAPEAIFIYASTNKVYGDLAWVRYEERATRYVACEFPRGFPETTPLEFHSPYGCSKGAADQYTLDFARMFGLRTVVFRHSSMYGGRQYATSDQGWIGWFCAQALAAKDGRDTEPFTISGSGKQVRDVLHAHDMIDLYFAAVEHIDAACGQAFNIGGGPSNSLSLLELFSLLETELDVRLRFVRQAEREGDQRVFIANISKARDLLKWQPRVSAAEGLKSMLQWVKQL